MAAWYIVAGSLPYDTRVLRTTYHAVGRRFDRASDAITFTAEAWVLGPLAVVTCAVLVARREWRAAGLVIAAAAVIWVVNPALKRAFGRERPSVRPPVEPVSRYAFPSGHAVASMAVASVLVVLAWHTRWRAVVVAGATTYVVLVGASLLVLGVHAPSDVVAGWALSVAWVTAAGAALLAGPTRRRADSVP